MVQKVVARIEGWNGRLMSSGGQLVLLKHVLQVLPVHIFASMDPLTSIIRQLEGCFTKKFWGSSEGSTRQVWRSWEQMLHPTMENGIGVRRLEDVVAAFSYKLWWKLR